MAATQLSNFGIPPTPNSLSRTRDILVETMQLVEPRKETVVPNHLLESKIYCKVAQNDSVQAKPSILHFGGFEPGCTVRQVLSLANVSSDVQRMHIIPPQSKYFDIKYQKGDRLVPGLTLDCVVEFCPDEWRYYYDCIRIHTAGNENLIIPIHAFPVMNTSDFPTQMEFPRVPIGQSMRKTFPLKSQAPVDFEFQLTYIQPHPSFIVNPLSGIVPANGDIDIEVTFTPTQFQTSIMRLQLNISQFNSRPVECLFTGFSAPGLEKEKSQKSTMASLMKEDSIAASTLDPRAISPLDRARSKKRQKTIKSKSTLVENVPQEIEFAGIKFPLNLDTPHAVAQVLNQEPGKLRIKDLREAVLSKTGGGGGAATRQMKEAIFEMAVRRDVYEERQNQLRWQVKIGDDQISQKRRMQIVDDREAAWNEYKLKRGDPVFEEETKRSQMSMQFRRTHRDISQIEKQEAQFDTYTNDVWTQRFATLWRFQQAARTVILRLRADKKLSSLRQMFVDWRNKKYKATSTALEKEKDDEEEEAVMMLGEHRLSIERIKGFNFPTYAAPDMKDDMAVDALGEVPFLPTVVNVKKKIPYHALKVPLQYKILAYEPHDVHSASLNYVPFDPMRPLRKGAEDEVINLPPSVATETQNPSVSDHNGPVSLIPPPALFQPMAYPPLHIFNPAPGLQVYLQALPYSEIDQDFHLCPLPRYVANEDSNNPHTSTQKQYLHKEDTIKGVMTWKRFPSQGLTSLANTPTLTNVWVPRWNEPFCTDILPEDTPSTSFGLSSVDREVIQDGNDHEECTIELTPEMVNAQFPLIDAALPPDAADKQSKEDNFPYGSHLPQTNIPVSATGPVPRERREQELDFFLKKRYNRLGSKIISKVQHLDNLKSNKDLILK